MAKPEVKTMKQAAAHQAKREGRALAVAAAIVVIYWMVKPWLG